MALIETTRDEAAAPRKPAGSLPVVAVVIAVAALLAAVGAAGAVRRGPAHQAAPGVDALFLDWPARGSLRDETALIEEAVRIWDGKYGPPGLERPHSDVRVLYAEQLDIGQVFLLQGRDHLGLPSLGLAAIPPVQGFPHVPPQFRSGPIPDPLRTRHLSFMVQTDGWNDRAKLVVLGEPGTTTIAWAEEDHPYTFLPVYVDDGAGVVETDNRGVRRIRVGNPDGTIYEGPMDVRWVNAA